MKAVVQRVKFAKLSVDGKFVSEIQKGMLVLLGVKVTDTEKDSEYFADKLSKLRIFEDENGKMNLSAKDVGGEVLLVSNFTLYGTTKGTNRPDFMLAQKPQRAEELFNLCANLLKQKLPTKLGIFGADMKIEMCADGPTTIIVENERS